MSKPRGDQRVDAAFTCGSKASAESIVKNFAPKSRATGYMRVTKTSITQVGQDWETVISYVHTARNKGDGRVNMKRWGNEAIARSVGQGRLNDNCRVHPWKPCDNAVR